MPLLLSCLEHTKGRPFQAFCVLSAVVADDKSKQAALAQMHGVLYVSKMLKPTTVEQEDSGVSPSGEAQKLPHANLAIVHVRKSQLRPHHEFSRICQAFAYCIGVLKCVGPEHEGLINFESNLRVTFEAVQLLHDLLSHDPVSRQPVTVSHSSCVKPALPAGASPSSPSGLRSTSADQDNVWQVVGPFATEARDQQSSRPEHGRLTCAALM